MSFALADLDPFVLFVGLVVALTVLALAAAVAVVVHDFRPAQVSRTSLRTRGVGRLATTH